MDLSVGQKLYYGLCYHYNDLLSCTENGPFVRVTFGVANISQESERNQMTANPFDTPDGSPRAESKTSTEYSGRARHPVTRLFIAAQLPPNISEELARTVGRIAEEIQCKTVIVPPENIHLTLRFIGSVALCKMDDITLAMAVASKGFGKIRAGFSSPGVFPTKTQPQTLWVGLNDPSEQLSALADKLSVTLEEMGIVRRERRKFLPHVTLIRLPKNVTSEKRIKAGVTWRKGSFQGINDFTIARVALFNSSISGGRAVHTKLKELELG